MLNSLELVILRSVIVYLFIIFAIRLFGKKELSQLSVVDLVFILLISNSVQNAMVGDNNTLLGGLVAAISLFLVNYVLKTLFFKSKKFSEFVQGEPLLLIYHGKVLAKHLEKAQLTHSELEAAVREHGVEAIAKVDMAVLEVDGNISVASNDFKKRTVKKRLAHRLINRNE